MPKKNANDLDPAFSAFVRNRRVFGIEAHPDGELRAFNRAFRVLWARPQGKRRWYVEGSAPESQISLKLSSFMYTDDMPDEEKCRLSEYRMHLYGIPIMQFSLWKKFTAYK